MPNPGEEGIDAGGDDFLKTLGLEGGEKPSPEPSTMPESQEPPQQQVPSQQPQTVKFAGREYKSMVDAEKAYKSLYDEFSKRSQRLNQLEGLWKHPEMQSAFSKRPELARALKELGYLKEVQKQGERERGDSGEFDWEGPEGRILRLEARYDMDRELASLERELKRNLSQEETNQIMKAHADLGGHGTLKHAWMLTDSYQKTLMESSNREAAVNAKKAGPARPRPIPGVIPGQKLDLKKPVAEMNPVEWREALRQEILEQGGAE